MLDDVFAAEAVKKFGLAGVAYFPRYADSRLHGETSAFLSSVDLPSNKLFSTKKDFKGISNDESGFQLRIEVVEQMKQRISDVDEIPLGSSDSPWNAVLDEIAMGMWG